MKFKWDSGMFLVKRKRLIWNNKAVIFAGTQLY